MQYVVIPEGGECGLRADAIEDAVERIGDLRSDFEDRDILSELSDFVLPCAAGLVCRREGLESGVCRPEDTTGQLHTWKECMYMGEHEQCCVGCILCANGQDDITRFAVQLLWDEHRTHSYYNMVSFQTVSSHRLSSLYGFLFI